MKITVKEQIEREIELSFPMSFKDGSVFYHCYSENNCVCVYTLNNSINVAGFNAISRNYSPENECTKAEVEEAFSKVVSHLQGLLSDVTENTNLGDIY